MKVVRRHFLWYRRVHFLVAVVNRYERQPTWVLQSIHHIALVVSCHMVMTFHAADAAHMILLRLKRNLVSKRVVEGRWSLMIRYDHHVVSVHGSSWKSSTYYLLGSLRDSVQRSCTTDLCACSFHISSFVTARRMSHEVLVGTHS